MRVNTLTIAMLGAIAFMATSCSTSDEIDEQHGLVITLRPVVPRDSRATETVLANMTSFQCDAMSADPTKSFSDVFTYNAGSYLPGTQHYWPVDNTELEFFCYSPASTLIDATSHGITGFRPAAGFGDQTDIVVAYNKGKKSSHGATGVPLNFRHVLSQIEIRAKNTGSVYKYEVVGVRIGSVVTKGDMSIKRMAYSPGNEGDGADWTLSTADADKGDYISTWETPIVLGNEAASMMGAGGNAMILPQQLTAWALADGAEKDMSNTRKGSFLALKLSITATVDNNKMYPRPRTGVADTPDYGWACIPIDTNWKQGYKYIYTLDFTNGAGKYPPEDPIVPGEDILTDPIRFTVTVEPWQTDDGNHNLNM